MKPFSAFNGFYLGELALVLGPDTLVFLDDVAAKRFVVSQHGVCIDEGTLTALQAKRFAEAATGTREITRTTADLNCLVGRAVA